MVNDLGKPRSTKGKCGKSPLVIGKDRTCGVCGKLICGACGFCTPLCQEKLFHSKAAINRARQVKGPRPQRHVDNHAVDPEAPAWPDLPPLDAYERDTRES